MKHAGLDYERILWWPANPMSSRERAIRMTSLVGLLLLLAQGMVVAQVQDKAQQKCITKLNKDGSKVAAAQGKENSKCILFAGKGKLDKLEAASAQACLTTDAKGKVQKKRDKTSDDEADSCADPGSIPDFGIPTGTAVALAGGTAAAVSTAAMDQEVALVGDIFGPNLHAAIIDCGEDKPGCGCQAKVMKGAEKIAAAKIKEFLKCKKFALKDGGKLPFPNGASSAADLADCVDDAGTAGSIAADTKSKISKKVTKLKSDIGSKCAPGEVLSPEPFPGYCVGLSGDALGDCIDGRVECRVCLMINAMDGLEVDCDLFDDTVANGSCPPVIIEQETLDIASEAKAPNTPGTPGVVVTSPKLITQFGGSSFDLNRARYTRHHWRNNPTPDAILILVPGFEGGAGDFKLLAENLLARSLAKYGQTIEVWAFDRRSNQLEDTEGLDIAEDLLDPLVGLDWLFGGELGLTLHPALQAGPNRRAVFYNEHDDVPFIANWTNLVFSRDIDAVVDAALAAVGNGNVFLGGHSAGTGFTARYAATDFDLTGLGPADPGYEKLRGLVLFDGSAGSTSGTPPTDDTLDRIEAKFDGGLFGAVRDNLPRCVDGTTPCTIGTEDADCAAFTNTKCTEPTTAYAIVAGILNPQILASVEPAAIQGVTDPDRGRIILRVDQGAPGNNAVEVVPELATLKALPPSTVQGGIGGFIDDDGLIASIASFVATSVGAPGPVVEGLTTWLDITEGPLPPSVLPDNGPPPTSLPAPLWGQEKEVSDLDRVLTTFFAGGTNFTDWYYPSSGLGVTAGLPSLDSSALSLDPPAGRGRRDIENLTQAANIDIPVIGFGGSNGAVRTPASLLGFAQSIGTCTAPSCDGITPRVVDPALPNPAFPTFGDEAGGFEVHISEGFAHVDVPLAEDNDDNNVLGPLADFLARNSQ